jgi:hypothetical protein
MSTGSAVVDEKGFRAFLKEGKRVPENLKESAIRSSIRYSRRFEEFLDGSRPRRTVKDATSKDARRFIKQLAKTEENTLENLIGLLRYARFLDNRDLELELLVTLDGGDVLGKLMDAAKDSVGEAAYYEMFSGFRPPPLGTPHTKMPRFTKDFMKRIQDGTDRDTCRSVLLTGVHAGPPESYADEIEMLRGSKDVDEYLAKRRQEMIDLLEGHMRDGTLFFTQEIDGLCMEFVRNNPEVAGGVRKGNYIYETKIPYMMKECLRERDPKKRRYYYCHCPLAREAIMTGEEIPRDFCYCSAGYEKKPFEVAFGMPVKTVVLNSVLWGDDFCRFRMEIPEKYRVRKKRKKKPTRGRAGRARK